MKAWLKLNWLLLAASTGASLLLVALVAGLAAVGSRESPWDTRSVSALVLAVVSLCVNFFQVELARRAGQNRSIDLDAAYHSLSGIMTQCANVLGVDGIPVKARETLRRITGEVDGARRRLQIEVHHGYGRLPRIPGHPKEHERIQAGGDAGEGSSE
ncbi:hypothetical protein HQ576_09355 [bacterium]|nr:hypothetical protein [bacterium]